MKRDFDILLIDLPTFPKGVLSLSFSAIAAAIPKNFIIHFVDLNFSDLSHNHFEIIKQDKCFFAGIKVSAQNFDFGIKITKILKSYNSELKIIWGGEFPSLLPQEASLYADAVVCGAFESIAEELIHDLGKRNLKKIYNGTKNYDCSRLATPNFSFINNPQQYSQTIGFPMETSRGCDKKCTFCMAHTMQPLNNFKTPSQLKNELAALKGKFVNVIDYNLGSDRNHLNNVIGAFMESDVLGWMGEMCLEALDDDVLLAELSESKCRIIYCGLESIENESLISINKAKTNNIENYVRIIRKVQKHKIHIAAGIIIGMEGATKKSIDNTFQFYYDMGLIYAKITFLTYNPGSKVYESMKRVGEYVTEEYQYFDGNHFTFLPKDVNREEITSAMIQNVRKFYSVRNVFRRARKVQLNTSTFLEFVFFNLSYKEAYMDWLKKDIFNDEKGFRDLLKRKHKKSILVSFADAAISVVRKKMTR